MRTFSVASAISALLLTTGVSAEPLKPDQFSSAQQSEFVRWLQKAGDASASCKRKASPVPDERLQLSRQTCEDYRDKGQPSRRVRRIVLDTKDLTWEGYRITRLEYEQSYSMTESLVYHAAIVYTLDAEYKVVSKNVQALWAKQDQVVEREAAKGGLFVTRNSITQSIVPAGGRARFMSEFHE